MPASFLGLYPIVDLDALRLRAWDPLEFAADLLRTEPPILQLRAKQAGAREALRLLEALERMTRGTPTLLVANDRADLAVLSGAGAVHVGQNDLDVERVRRAAPQLRVGVSTHTSEQLERALAAKPDYVAFGPVFPTVSKERADTPVGLGALRAAALRARECQVPLVAIGGINEATLPAVGEIGAAAALIGALFPPSGRLDDVAAHVRRLRDAYESGRPEA